MIYRLLDNDETNAIVVVGLSGAIVAMVAGRSGYLSFERMLSGVLSNPVPRQAASAASRPGVSLVRAVA